ncbi:MAG TPA: ABC transporter ATP-binding protein/permease [Methylomirabilota bacterium]|nr:ABC transporter ATP-binding protein/permease [Methylomirabilota bacterium]
MTDIRQFLRDTWRLARPYWSSEDRWAARSLLGVVVAMNLGLVGINVLVNRWQAVFFNAIQEKNAAVFFHQLWVFSGLAAAFITVAVYQLYLNQMLQIRWRRWLTDRYLNAWLSDRTYYRMQLMAGDADNPDQRIAEDVRLFVSRTLSLSLQFLSAAVTLVTFVGILWTLSGPVTILGWRIPGYMVWAALLYSIVGTWLTEKVGRRLVGLEFDQQRYEADFRFSLVRFRENTEGVALYRGEKDELVTFRQRFANVVRNWRDIMSLQKRLTGFTVGYAQLANIFPYVVQGPRYFAGEIALGGLQQTADAFGQVQSALSLIVDYQLYPQIAEWRAVVNRLTGFEAAMARSHPVPGSEHIERLAGPDGISLQGVDLNLPDGQPLLNGVATHIGSGESVLVTGPSGAGKSTLFRAIAGIWPFGRGRITMPPDARVLFLPQKPYLPIGTLREVVSYPMREAGATDAELREALETVGLPKLVSRLDESENWAMQLSPGEQQRIAFARALIQKPDWLFLDEATSAVDEDTEQRLYALVKERLASTTVISVGHRPTLGAFHNRRLVVRPNRDQAASLEEATATT